MKINILHTSYERSQFASIKIRLQTRNTVKILLLDNIISDLGEQVIHKTARRGVCTFVQRESCGTSYPRAQQIGTVLPVHTPARSLGN